GNPLARASRAGRADTSPTRGNPAPAPPPSRRRAARRCRRTPETPGGSAIPVPPGARARSAPRRAARPCRSTSPPTRSDRQEPVRPSVDLLPGTLLVQVRDTGHRRGGAERERAHDGPGAEPGQAPFALRMRDDAGAMTSPAPRTLEEARPRYGERYRWLVLL